MNKGIKNETPFLLGKNIQAVEKLKEKAYNINKLFL